MCLEEPDRIPAVVEVVWPELWRRLHPAPATGEPVPTSEGAAAPDLGDALAPLVRQALVALEVDPDDGETVGFRIHPGVADTGRAATHPDTAALIDTLTGDAWLATLYAARDHEHEQQTSGTVVWAARSAGPYLLRRHRWTELADAAEQLLHRDGSTAAAAAVLPLLTTASDATRDSPDAWAWAANGPAP